MRALGPRGVVHDNNKEAAMRFAVAGRRRAAVAMEPTIVARPALAVALIAFGSPVALADEPCRNPDYKHGISYVLPMRYGADFEHFAYANPSAPKGGTMRLPQMGTYDNYNAIVEIGRIAAGYGAMGSLVYDRLLEDSIDEPASAYVRLADGVAVEEDYRWTAFRLRDGARWHDGRPITLDDVLFTFDAIREHGSVALRTTLTDLDRVFAFGDREVCFVTRPDAEPNPILPFIYGRIAILPKHYWESKDISKTTAEPPPGSGPYRLQRGDFGRNLTYERFPDYWGRDLPVNKGRYNFDVVKFDYFRDENVNSKRTRAMSWTCARSRFPRIGQRSMTSRRYVKACSAPSCAR